MGDIHPTPLQTKHANAQAAEPNQIQEGQVSEQHSCVDEVARATRLKPLVNSRIKGKRCLQAQELDKSQAAQQKGQSSSRWIAQGSVWLLRVPIPHCVDDDSPSP